MKTNKEICGRVFIILGTLLLGVCLLLVLHNRREDEEAKNYSSAQLSAIKQSIARRTDEIAGSNVDEVHISEKGDIDISEEKDVDTIDENNSEMPVIFIEGYGYIGYVSFPSLDLELPVMDEWDETRLKLAPCRYYGSMETDDLVVAGHNYRSGFGMMKNLNKGDEVYFTDMDGVVYNYRVEEIEVLDSAEVTKMVDSGWDFSIFTCSYDRARRLTIRCAKVES